ncbi:acidic mammalian chitinase-like [Centruroides sculpturatus]|uniref:acidic mammalian chitinase-like n=1 Tax=Centruroides sculpturatus TaxID=218467 RepID=UPI000C6D4889|nr:acidic mammalian chitinase-like [Centruroides sculpturatus]
MFLVDTWPHRLLITGYWRSIGGNYKNFVELKEYNKDLKILIAVGGWNTGSIKFSKLSSDSKKRKVFIDSALNLARKHNFDGVNINWQFPTRRGGNPKDKENFALLIKEMYEVFKSNKLILTIDMSASPNIIDDAYDLGVISRNVDFIHVTAFDYWGYWEPITGFPAALFARVKDIDVRLNVNYTVSYLKSLGVDLKKIVIIVSSTSQTWTLDDSSDTSVGAKATKPGNKGSYTLHPGILSYYETCKLLMQDGWTIKYDPEAKVPYAYRGDQWIGYDDVKSVSEKVKYVKNSGLAGLGLNSLDHDDFRDLCDNDIYPLLTAINDVLK